MVDHARRMLDWDYMVEALGDAVPCHEPGRAHGYHGMTYGWLIGELIQRVTGKPFSELLAVGDREAARARRALHRSARGADAPPRPADPVRAHELAMAPR